MPKQFARLLLAGTCLVALQKLQEVAAVRAEGQFLRTYKRHIRILALLGAAFLLAGCGDLLSLHGLYTAQDNVVDAALEGKWENKDNLLIVERAADFYQLILQSKQNPSEEEKFEMRLAHIGGVRFADILSAETMGHMFVRVRVTGGQLSVAFFDSEWLRARIPHEEADMVNHRKQAVLTAQTPELRSLVAKYAAEPRAYDEEITYQRSGKALF